MQQYELDCNPSRLARWLEVTLAQRSRAQTKAVTDYGSDSPNAIYIQAEISELRKAIDAVLQLKLPLTPNKK